MCREVVFSDMQQSVVLRQGSMMIVLSYCSFRHLITDLLFQLTPILLVHLFLF